jgi:hypothetical protein
MNFPFFNHVWQAMGSNWDDFDACFESGFPISGQATTPHNATDIEMIMVNCNAQVQAVINSAQTALPSQQTALPSQQLDQPTLSQQPDPSIPSHPPPLVSEVTSESEGFASQSRGDTDYITKSEVDDQIVMWVECVTEQVLKTGETTTANVKKLVDTAKAEVTAELTALTAECLKLEALARDLMLLPGVADEIARIKAERAEKWRKEADERAAKWRQTPYIGFDGPSLPDENAYPNEISLIDPYSGVRYHLGEPEYGKRVFSWVGEATVPPGFMCAHDDENPTHYIVSLENGTIERFPKDRYTIEYIGTEWFMFDTYHGSYIDGRQVYGNHSNDIRHSKIITTEFDECSREFEKVLAGTSDTIVNFKRWHPLPETMHMPAGTTVIVVNPATTRSYLLRMKFGDDGSKHKVIDVAFVSLNENLIWLADHDLNSAIRLKVDNLHTRCMMFGLRVNNPACTFRIVPGHIYVRR